MPLIYLIPGLSWLTWNIAYEVAWVSVSDRPSPLARTLLAAKPRIDASFNTVAGLLAPSASVPVKLTQRRHLPPTPTLTELLMPTPAQSVSTAGSGPGALLFCLLGALLFFSAMMMFVGRIDKTQGRNPAARYRAFSHTLLAVLCTVLSAPVACLDLCLDALVTLVVFVIGLWAQFCRIVRLALGLFLSLLWSVLVFDTVRFLVSCNVVGGIVIDFAKTVLPVVWAFVTHVV